MYKLAATAICALLAASSVQGALVPRKEPPAGWRADILEPYDEYHTRYLAIHCHLKHGKQFFDDCCHPMKIWEKLETARKPYCIPSNSQSSSAAAAEATSTVTTPADVPGGDPTVPTGVPDDDDDYEDCDDEEDQPQPTPTPAPAPTSNPAPPPPSNTPPPPVVTVAPQPQPQPTTPAPPAPQPPASNEVTGGFATFYFQNGNAGACGQFNPDSAFICAIDSRRYGFTGQRSELCGRSVTITNTNNGRTVQCTIADACPTCNNENSIDLSVAAFEAIATRDEGLVPISWHFN